MNLGTYPGGGRGMSAGQLAQFNDNPLYRAVGIHVHEAAEGRASVTLEPNPQLCWPFEGQPHGGVLGILLDTTMAWATFSELEPGYNCATLNLNIDYLAPARGRRFTCQARSVHRTGRLNFVRAEIRNESGDLVTIAQAVFRVVRVPDRQA